MGLFQHRRFDEDEFRELCTDIYNQIKKKTDLNKFNTNLKELIPLLIKEEGRRANLAAH